MNLWNIFWYSTWLLIVLKFHPIFPHLSFTSGTWSALLIPQIQGEWSLTQIMAKLIKEVFLFMYMDYLFLR